MFPNDTRIMIVEDTEITRTVAKKMLSKMGFNRVTETVNGTEAWQEISKVAGTKNSIQLIIADWNMPGLNGIDLLRTIQADAKTKDTPFILLTSNIGREHVVEAIQSGVIHYMAKPFSAKSLEKKMKEAWDYYKKPKAA